MPRPQGSLFYKSRPRTAQIRRKRWNWPGILWKAIKRTCMLIGALVLFSALMGAISVFRLMGDAAPVLPGDMILVLKLEDGVSEVAREPTLTDPLAFTRPTIRTLVEAIDRGRADPRVRGLMVSVKSGSLELAHIEELRAAVKRLRAAGKFAFIYSESYGDFGTGMGIYYLASAFDEIWMQPVGILSLSGISAEVPFAREALDKIGVEPQFFKREQYKNAMESLTDTQMSEPSREMLESIVGSLSDHMIAQIAGDRGTDEQTLRGHIDQGLFTGNEALEAGLIDRLEYADVLISETRQQYTDDPDNENLALVPLDRYAPHSLRLPGGGKPRAKVALVYASGPIMPGEAGEGVAAADRIATAITVAGRDAEVQAIVLRVDSPGGSPSASETIRRSIVRAQERGKKVIVSMGPVAASGGYWIAADADEIFALPTTLTGSIGVVMGKFVLEGMWTKLGINWETVRVGEHAGLWSISEPFSESEAKRMNAVTTDIYKAFIYRVAQGRELVGDDLKAVIRGRAFTGAQALELKLVDHLGGLDDALDRTAVLIGLESREQLELEILPLPESPLQRLLSMLGAQAALTNWIGAHAPLLEDAAAALEPVTRMPQGYGVYDPTVEFVR